MSPTTFQIAGGTFKSSQSEDRQKLGKNIKSAYVWTTVLQIGKNVLGFVISILLARSLQPADYGLVGMVMVALGIIGVFQDWGIGQAVIYFPEDSEKHLATYFTVTTLNGCLLMLITYFGAPYLAAFYHEPRLVAIIRALSITFLTGGIWAVSQSLLTKTFRFRSLTLIETGCTLGAGIVAVVLAWTGFGVWSLVMNILLQSLAQTALYSWYVPPRFTLRLDRSLLKGLLKWGVPLTGSSLLWRFYDNSDYLVIGKLLGAPALGSYTLAFRLATVANDKISSVVNRVSFPSFSAMHDDLNAVVEHWLSVTRKLAWLNIPVLIALALNAEDFVHVALGPKWLGAAALVKYLCLVGGLKSLTSIIVNLVAARGRTDIGFHFALLNTLLLPTSFWIACKFGSLKYVCIAWCLAYSVTCTFLVSRAARLVGIQLRKYFENLLAPSVVGALCFLSMLPFSWLIDNSLSRLILRSMAGVITFTTCLLLRPDVRASVRSFARVNRKAVGSTT